MKLTQIKRVEVALKRDGFVSRNQFLDVQFDKITRLGAIIFNLRDSGLDISTEETHNDTIYRLKPKKIETYRIPETGEVFQKKVWI